MGKIDGGGIAGRGPAGSGEAIGRRMRTYGEVTVSGGDKAWSVALDGGPARTPKGVPMVVPSRALAAAAAGEWAAQGELIEPSSMPLTRLVNSAIDAVAGAPAAVREDIVKYAGSDLVCYRAGEPASLAAAQCAAWDPVLDWAGKALGARFVLAEGVVFAAQPEAAIGAVRDAVARVSSPFELTALHVMTTLTGSALIGLAVLHGRLTAEEAWRAAHVDEDEQMRIWGEDAEAAVRRARRWREMAAAARMIALLRA
jgi:chaperone required for assembly of F1-ATPase